MHPSESAVKVINTKPNNRLSVLWLVTPGMQQGDTSVLLFPLLYMSLLFRTLDSDRTNIVFNALQKGLKAK